jgi:hypothetical protein
MVLGDPLLNLSRTTLPRISRSGATTDIRRAPLKGLRDYAQLTNPTLILYIIFNVARVN